MDYRNQNVLCGCSSSMHTWNGSPVLPLGHLQMATWFLGVQSAPFPHENEQGSTQRKSLHAWSTLQSSLAMQSPLTHLTYGSPACPSGQEQVGRCPLFSQMAFSPQGLFTAHGSFRQPALQSKIKRRVWCDTSLNHQFFSYIGTLLPQGKLI